MIGMAEATTNPSITDLTMALSGFRLEVGTLDKETVSMIARSRIVILLLMSDVSTSLGKTPEKFVMNARMSARLIINALLHSNAFTFMGSGMSCYAKKGMLGQCRFYLHSGYVYQYLVQYSLICRMLNR